jgi:hypothetical protein
MQQIHGIFKSLSGFSIFGHFFVHFSKIKNTFETKNQEFLKKKREKKQIN